MSAPSWSFPERALWSAALIVLGGYACVTSLLGIGFRIESLLQGPASLVLSERPGLLLLRVAVSIVTALVFCVFGVALAWHKSRDLVAALGALALFTTAITCSDLSATLPWTKSLHTVLCALNPALLMYLLLLFPGGRFVTGWSMWLGHGWAAFCLACLLIPTLPFNIVYFETWSMAPLHIIASLTVIFAPYALALAFLRRRGLESPFPHVRAQHRWLWIGTASLFVGLLGNTVARVVNGGGEGGAAVLSEIAQPIAVNALMLMLPLGLGIAHHRHRLFGSEIVAEKTLTYLALSLLIVVLYGAFVAGMAAVGQGATSNLIFIGLALGFTLTTPSLRHGLQTLIRFALYRRREPPQQTVARLSHTVAGARDSRTALRVLRSFLEHDLQFESGAIDVLAGDGVETVERWGPPGGGGAGSHVSSFHFELRALGDVVGILRVATGRPQRSWHDDVLLEEIVRHASFAAHALRLTVALQRAREERVMAFEAELKRLRNDVHDSVAPNLVALARHLDVALDVSQGEASGAADPAFVHRLVERVQRGLLDSVRELRHVVNDLRPARLDEFGLVRALEELGSDAAVPVRLETANVPAELPAAIEVSVYRIALEAVANVHRHARARVTRMSLACDERALRLIVEDDGVGLDAEAPRGVGLASMRQRAEELGGTVVFERVAAPGSGTRVLVTLPLHR